MLNIFNTRLILALVFSTIIIMSLFGAGRFYLSQRAFDRELDFMVQQTADRITSAVKPSIWALYSQSVERAFSQEFAAAVLNSELIGEYVVGVVVYGQFGHIYMGKWKNEQGEIFSYEPSQRRQLLEYADLVRPYRISFDTMTLGKLELFIDTKAFDKQQKDALLIELIQIVIVSIFFVIVLFHMIKRALFAPMKKLEMARKTFESMREAIVFTGEDGIIYESNQAFLDMAKSCSDDVIGSNIQNFLPHSEGRIDLLLKQGNDGDSWQGEIDFYCSGKQKMPVYLTISLVNNDSSSNTEFVFVFQDISEQKNAQEKLQQLAFYDALTDLANRQYFEKELASNLRAAKRQHQHLSLIFIDLDNFKEVNDTLGHGAGDKVLIEAAKRFTLRLREADFLSRIGGDEFTVIVNGSSDSEEVAGLAKDLITSINQPIVINDLEFKIGASIGIASYPDDASNEEELIKNADIAMYNAKNMGKNQISFFSTDLNDKVEHYFDLRNRIDLAIKNNEFQLFYQPKVNLFNNRVQAAEGLIRWFTSDGAMISPDDFIPLAEETKQIIPIGQWVIETAIKQLKQWQGTEFSQLSLSINVSPIQLYSDNFISHLEQTLAKFSVDPLFLEIEITETAIIADAEKAIVILDQLKEIGVKLSLDDFGTGYSSLSYLQLLPVDILKIDRSFIASASQTNASGKILSSIINLAQDLAIDVVAEGIEDQVHLQLLKSKNCRLGQGYLFSRPLAIDQFELRGIQYSLK